MMSATAAGTAPDRREVNEEVEEFVMVEYCTRIQPAEQNETGAKRSSRYARGRGHPSGFCAQTTSGWAPAFAGVTKNAVGVTRNAAGVARNAAGVARNTAG